LKSEWNKETFVQELFEVTWSKGKKVEALQDYVTNFVWIYGNVNDDGEAVNILL
jgi:hypothetical protein